MPRPDDIVAYTYKADLYCPTCIVRQIELDRRGERIVGENAEAHLDEIARVLGIDREDERSFDSDEFPKVVFRDQLGYAQDAGYDERDRCGRCGKELG